jgi:hypothetical protein
MTRTVVVAMSIAALAAGVLLALGLLHYAEAQALADAHDAGLAVAPVLPSPESDPGWFVERVRGLWRSGEIPSAIILGLFGVLSMLRGKVAWLNKGKQAVIVAAVLGTLTMLVTEIASGSSPNLSMLVSALLVGIGLYWKSEPKS